MKFKNKIILSVIVLILAIVVNTKVQAASAKLSVSSSNVTPGTKVTITTTIKGASWQINLSGAVSATYSDSTSDAEDTTKTETTSFTPSKAGTYKVNLSGNVTGSNDTSSTKVSDSVTITVKEKTSDNNSSATTVSTDATLKNLGIKPNDFSGFKKATTSYNVEVPKSVEKISIYATPTDSKATVSGTGSKELKIGKNTFNIKVTAEDKKTTKTYTLNITRKKEEEISKDANLSNLGIRPKEYDFTGFKSNKTEYKVFVPNDVEKINIYAYPSSDKATVTGNGEKTLKLGENTFNIKVTAEDKKTTKTYTLVVTKDEKEDNEEDEKENNEEDEKNQDTEKGTATAIKEIIGITDLKIKNYKLSPDFDNEKYQYTVDVTEDVTELDIEVETSGDNIETDIVGNKDLQKGNNIITILSHNTKTNETKTYQITAYVGNKKRDLEAANKEIDAAQKDIRIKSWILKGVIIAIIILTIIFFIYRHRLQNEDDYEDDEEETEISETKKFYNEMEKDDDYYNEQPVHKEKNSGRYKGKRFK